MKKKKYRIRNWSEYNTSLRNRGSITVWISEDVLQLWYSSAVEHRRRGRPATYSDKAIEMLLILRAVYHLALRQTVGLGQSVIQLLQLDVEIPSESTLSRRSRQLQVVLPRVHERKTEELHVVLDSTGVKVMGAGEWHRKRHTKRGRRRWRKLHLAVDESSGELLSAVVSEEGLHDSHGLPLLLDAMAGHPIKTLGADGIYDTRKVWERLQEDEITALIPPRKNARIWQHGNSKAPPLARDEILRYRRQHGSRQWKQQSGYHRRSIAETAMSRYKRVIGERVRSRSFATQATEILIGCVVLNRCLALGAPDSYAVP